MLQSILARARSTLLYEGITGRIKVYLRERGDAFPFLDEICIFYGSYFGQILPHIPQTENNNSPQCISMYLTKPEQRVEEGSALSA